MAAKAGISATGFPAFRVNAQPRLLEVAATFKRYVLDLIRKAGNPVEK
jgi:hypothetical protein